MELKHNVNMDEEVLVDPEQQRIFYGFVREFVITLLLCIIFYVISHSIIDYFRQRRKINPMLGNDEVAVHKITVFLCSIAVSVSLGAVVLLPFSILSNEIRHIYSDTYYVKWLDTSLIRDLWNLIFLGSNLCLFLLLPFAYFFYEAEGLPGTRKGIMSRVYEAVIVLILVSLLVLGTVWVADALTLQLNTTNATSDDLATEVQNLLSYVPFLYSCMSMLGILLACFSTPVGFSQSFTVLTKLIVQPELHVNVDQELDSLKMEETVIKSKKSTSDLFSVLSPALPKQSLQDINIKKDYLERHRKSSVWERHVLFPLCFVMLLLLTVFSLLLVTANILSLVVSPTQYAPQGAQEHLYRLGDTSSSYLGPLGAALEVMLIVYMIGASIVGFYSSPLTKQLTPQPHHTSIIKIILNCIVLLVLSSAMPVMVRILGFTKFHLLGHFSSIGILQSFWLVLFLNITFFVLTTCILFKRATQSALKEISYLLRNRVNSLRIAALHRTKAHKLHTD